ncbi:hypothetical protein PINS_up003164 [Pythium insidiosum]|nr:hypothetical protein PINS_up003164 [Pythium insidiosum]
MSDSDSDDELMNRLAKGVFSHVQAHHENCAYCATPRASLPCTTCEAAFYCTETCKRRHFSAHRNFCLSARQQKEQSEEEVSSEEESESEVESPREPLRRGSSMARRSSSRGAAGFASEGVSAMPAAAGIQVPGLSAKQVKKLLELSAKAESMTSSKAIEDLQQQIAQLMAQRESEVAERTKRESEGSTKRALERAGSALSDIKVAEIKELQKKLAELEKKTQTLDVTTRHSLPGPSGAMRSAKPVVYIPLLVKDDDAFKKYFKLKDMDMPIEQIKAKMESDGVNPALLDTPDEISPNDPGAPEGAYIPMLVRDDPKFKKFFKLKMMNMPVDNIKLKMEAEGFDPELLDNPCKVSPNDPGVRFPTMSGCILLCVLIKLVSMQPPLYVEPVGYDPAQMRMSMPSMFSPTSAAFPPPPLSSPATTQPAYVPLLVKDDEQFNKFFKLRQMGMPAEQIKLKMSAEGLDPTLLDRPDDVSPNDPGPPAVSATTGAPASGPISMEQLFSILMQHQQIIQQVSTGNASLGGSAGRSSSTTSADGAKTPPSVEDQMAKELAAAESALDDIFGDEQQQSKGMGGMSMIEQLEKKARRENNKKLVDNRDQINALIQTVLTTTFQTDDDAMRFYMEVNPRLESLGLALGVDATQTWSARLLIKNKDTRDWYFSEQERLDAGRAYGRLWSMSFLERDTGQLIQKRMQIEHAPITLRANVKNKAELLDKFTQLLKDTVKLKHKVFKNALFAAERRRMQENRVPERFDERGDELTNATVVLADAALDLAEEEFRVLDNTTRAKKIRAHAAIHVAEKAVQLVGIVKKLGAKGVNESRLRTVETRTQELKEEFAGSQQQDEDEDDVL